MNSPYDPTSPSRPGRPPVAPQPPEAPREYPPRIPGQPWPSPPYPAPPLGTGQFADPPVWHGLAPMRSVDHVDSGFSDTYWRAEQAAARRRGGQRWGLPAALVVMVANLVGFLAAPYAFDHVKPGVYVVAIMAPTVLAVLVALALSFWRGNGPVVDFGLPTNAREFLSQIGTGLVFGAAAVIGGLLIGVILISHHDLNETSPLSEVAAMPDLWRFVLAAWVWIGAPFGEELLFRGLLWGALEKRDAAQPQAWRWLGNRWVILVVTALAFAAWHREWWRFPVLLFGGVAIGMARMRSGSVFASGAAHSVNNTLPALSVLFMPALYV